MHNNKPCQAKPRPRTVNKNPRQFPKPPYRGNGHLPRAFKIEQCWNIFFFGFHLHEQIYLKISGQIFLTVRGRKNAWHILQICIAEMCEITRGIGQERARGQFFFKHIKFHPLR
jgi:hypothetical protein